MENIKYIFVLKGLQPKEIYEQLLEVYKEFGCSAPKQVKSQRSAKKVMASVFLECIDYLQKDKTINSEYYCSLLDQLDEQICEKRPSLQHKN